MANPFISETTPLKNISAIIRETFTVPETTSIKCEEGCVTLEKPFQLHPEAPPVAVAKLAVEFQETGRLPTRVTHTITRDLFSPHNEYAVATTIIPLVETDLEDVLQHQIAIYTPETKTPIARCATTFPPLNEMLSQLRYTARTVVDVPLGMEVHPVIAHHDLHTVTFSRDWWGNSMPGLNALRIYAAWTPAAANRFRTHLQYRYPLNIISVLSHFGEYRPHYRRLDIGNSTLEVPTLID